MTLASGLFLTLPPLVELLKRQWWLLVPLAVLVVLYTAVSLVNAATLSIPLASLSALLSLLSSSLFFSYATLFINLTPLPWGPPLILITLVLRPTPLLSNTSLFVSLTLLIKTAAILLCLILPG